MEPAAYAIAYFARLNQKEKKKKRSNRVGPRFTKIYVGMDIIKGKNESGKEKKKRDRS